jgi:hypothetical protein
MMVAPQQEGSDGWGSWVTTWQLHIAVVRLSSVWKSDYAYLGLTPVASYLGARGSEARCKDH